MVVGRGSARFLSCAPVLGLLAAVSVVGCAADTLSPEGEPIGTVSQAVSPPASAFPSTFARQWMTNLALSVKGDNISPPVAARTYAYGAIAIYESVVHGMAGHRSLAGQLNGLDSLPQPDAGLTYDWPTVLAQTMGQMTDVQQGTYVFPLRLFFEFTTPSQAAFMSLSATQIALRQNAGVPQNVIDNSIAYGNQLAGALRTWANADGYGQARFKGYVAPKCTSCWVPTGFSDTDKVAQPLEPAFGTLRPLVLHAADECAPPPAEPYSTDPSSSFYSQANIVYQTDVGLTQDQENIARFWADGPGDTTTPAGHWVTIMTKFVRPGTLADAASGYVLTSIGFYDAFIACWHEKYASNLLRPETYIRANIPGAAGWKPLLPTPQFPTYISGHSTQSGASAVLMTSSFGSGPFTDDTKTRRGFLPRSFPNFTAAAQEAAVSRLYGGIHFPMDNNAGVGTGQCVGNTILSRVSLTL